MGGYASVAPTPGQYGGRRIQSVTPMKNEGPYILEWVAYHRLIGINDILIFSNDCTDGSDQLLDRLDELGYIRHYGNPSVIMNVERHHLAVIRYLNTLSRVHRADWVVSLDADEFICINTGDGTLDALIEACAGADVISMNQLNFGCGGQGDFTDELQIDRFIWAQRYAGGKNPTGQRRGVKSLTRIGAPVVAITNHSPRPDPERSAELTWVNGAGKPLPQEMLVKEIKSFGEELCAYDLVQLNHYALRSMDSFLTQVFRGNANHANRAADMSYWRKHNLNEQLDTRIQRWSAPVKTAIAEMLQDGELAALHQATVAHHRAHIEELKGGQDLSRLRRLVENAHNRGWPELATTEAGASTSRNAPASGLRSRPATA
ncbi:glycosyltransferase family 2 protein [Vannielia litorea]|uniref:glycosyltransferase family 2 protein n=1 Tax=Vannielia litorea TaxID=1217970 RepID=UPI0011150DB9|nr:glycosyltransferase family 2 protein [Vannielia litorea]